MTEVVNRSPAMGSERALQTALEMSMMDINNIDDDVAELYSSYEEDSSKSLNVTQCVSVPSSEHVAEIVGKQGNYAMSCSLLHVYACTDAGSLLL